MKSKKIIITLSVLVLILIPITIVAGSNIIEKVKVVPDQPDPVVPDNNVTTSEYFDNTIYETDDELEAKLTKAEEINERENKKIEQIINKFYAEEFKLLKEETSKLNNFSPNGYYTDESPEPKFYNLVLYIIEYKNLTEDEANTLKTFMLEQESNIHNRPDITERIEKLCKSELR